MSVDGTGKFEPTAWTPARTALWVALSGDDKKILERWVANGSDAPVPPQWEELHKSLADIEVESVVPDRIFDHMRKRGWKDTVIESVYAKQFRAKAETETKENA